MIIEALAALTMAILSLVFVLLVIVIIGPPIWIACGVVWLFDQWRKSPEEKR